MAKKKAVRRKKVVPSSIGLTPAEAKDVSSGALDHLGAQVEEEGGAVLGQYNDPFGGQPLLIVALPVSSVEPTPYQRDPSEAHVKRLMAVVEKIGLFLDPIIAIRHEDKYWTPNGNHRLQALKKLGVRTVVALLVPAYQSILRRVDEFLDEPMNKALKERERRGRKILKLDEAVSAAVEKLKAKGLTSPYLKPFVVARVNYTRFSKATSFDFDATLDKIIASAQKFNVERVNQQDVAKAGGGPPPEDD
jgi:hypothetical protein